MAHPYLVASRRPGAGTRTGYQSSAELQRAPAPAPQQTLLDAFIQERSMQSPAFQRFLDNVQRSPNKQLVDDAIAPATRGLPRAGLQRVQLPKVNPEVMKGLGWVGGPGQSLTMLLQMYRMYQGHRASTTGATRSYPAFSGWSFERQCNPTPGIYGLFCARIQPNPGFCIELQADAFGVLCSDTNIGGVGHVFASANFIGTMGPDGVAQPNTRYATLEVYKRNPLGSTKGGQRIGTVAPHGIRSTDKAPLFGPLPQTLPKTGQVRLRPEAKWFPELAQPGGWMADPMAVPWSWVKSRPLQNPMRAPSEQSQVGPRPAPAPVGKILLAAGESLASSAAVAGASASLSTTPPGARIRMSPSRNVRETKLKVRGARAILAVVNFVTEGTDYIDAFYKALPKDCKRTKSQKGLKIMRPQHKLAAIAACWNHIDMKAAVKNLIENEVEDRVFGGIGKGLVPLNRAMGRPVGVQTGDGAPGKLPKGTQTGKKPWDNWTDYIWP